MMKKVVLTILLLLSLSTLCFAGERAGGGGGFYLFYNLPSLKPVNNYIAGYGFPSFGDNLIFFGGGGSGGKGRIELGGFGAGGGSTVFNGTNKAKLGIGFGGFRFNYYLKETDKFSLFASGGFGGVGADLLLIGDNSAEFTLSSFLLCAGLGFRYNLSRWLNLEIGVDYNYVPQKNWRREAGILPEPDALDLSGINIRVGLQFGGRIEKKVMHRKIRERLKNYLQKEMEE